MNNYKIDSLIGEGSFGRVYKACRKTKDDIVALKVITKRGKSNKELKNLRRECEIQCHLKHPNIIEMLESFETKNEIVVVTEFAQMDLHKYLLEKGLIDEEKAQKLTSHLVSALYYLHAHRILHRDLKPQNILLSEDINAKLCDFGLARNMTIGTHMLTSIKGTPLYMAPELLAAKPYDYQADFWSLGCIIYEAMCGQPPFCTSSIVLLLRMIRREEIKWPSFLSSDCISFLQGLLEKDPSLRMTWAQVMCHPFVEGRVLILKEDNISSPYTCPEKTKTESKTKKSKFTKISHNNIGYIEKNLKKLNLGDRLGSGENISSSKDSVNAIRQSDIEIPETDAEESESKFNIPFANESFHFDFIDEETDNNKEDYSEKEDKNSAAMRHFLPENSNLVVNHLRDNFSYLNRSVENKQKENTVLNKKKSTTTSRNKVEKFQQKSQLEKKKLTQNLDNFSVRLNQTTADKISDDEIEKDETNKNNNPNEGKNSTDNKPPSMLPGWDSCDESQSPPIENDEWLAFLYRSMKEILDGELDSLQQQNFVSIIVAPLRNSKASFKVVESVAQLLILPLVVDGTEDVIETIKNVYIEVKLVPNLVYASKLLTVTRSTSDSASSQSASASLNKTFKLATDLSTEELKTLRTVYELVCHLVHLNDRFLSQFCDAVIILSADELFINLLAAEFEDDMALRIASSLIALFCCITAEMPENVEIVEKIIFNPKLDLISIMRSSNDVLRWRICTLFMLLGKHGSSGLENVWSPDMQDTMEALMYDSNQDVRLEAEYALEEMKKFPFYEQLEYE